MEIPEALTRAMAQAKMRDEEVSANSGLSYATVRNVRSGYSKRPYLSTIDALKKHVPGFGELLESEPVELDSVA